MLEIKIEWQIKLMSVDQKFIDKQYIFEKRKKFWNKSADFTWKSEE